MHKHGLNLMAYRDAEQQDNTILHKAAKENNRELVEFLKQACEVNLDV